MKDSIKYIGCDDSEMKLFESQYVTPEGMYYNSYIIHDDKVAVMDGGHCRKRNLGPFCREGDAVLSAEINNS